MPCTQGKLIDRMRVVPVWVVATDEELVIARHTYRWWGALRRHRL